MDWLPEYDAELGQLWEDWAQMLPAIERAVRFEDRLENIERRLEILEGRNPLLESIQQRMKEKE